MAIKQNNSIKTINVHIGLHKTGTSSIQYTLYTQREILEEKGYLYPQSL